MRTRMFAALSALAALTVPLSATPAQAAPSPGEYTLTAAHSGKCLDIRNSSTANGAVLVQNTCDGRASQRFYLGQYRDRPDLYFIKTFAGKCVARYAASNHERVVTQENCVYDYSRSFRFHAYHPWPGEVISSVDWYGRDSHCFHIEGASSADGAAVITYGWNDRGSGARNDSFTLAPA
ncbi:RICIN domain-containing protein [Streptomyces uncialis]|uniref:RICIN domain-containing protein n=1 Tax=Streptomyces uncialis TaxID=1048205 RepID=UPI0038708630|nr:RICIN domain-containing protein [Streptomyces uncialis]